MNFESGMDSVGADAKNFDWSLCTNLHLDVVPAEKRDYCFDSENRVSPTDSFHCVELEANLQLLLIYLFHWLFLKG